MIAHVTACTLDGIDAVVVDVECEVARGLPFYSVVGLAAVSVKEGATRVRCALRAVNHEVPNKRVTVNLAPADVRKPGSGLDLPIAAAVLIADGKYSADPLRDCLVMGELGLDGEVRGVPGALAAAMLARDRGMRGLVVPAACVGEASLVDGVEVYGIAHIGQLIDLLAGRAVRTMVPPLGPRDTPASIDMADVRGQFVARAAIEIAVAGGHNLLLNGPPGTGKTMLARRIATVLPPLTRDEALATTKIYSAVGLADGLICERPFRAPHHSISPAALLGGGSPLRPGEISLAHNGVLFLDEFPEFSRTAIEGLRQPLEDRSVVINRVAGCLRLPASFLLVAAANPCPCGWLYSGVRTCVCGIAAIERYRHRLSGPLLDRIDMQVFVPPLRVTDLRSSPPGESSAAIRERVVRARGHQQRRLARHKLHCNAEMSGPVLRAHCPLDSAAELRLAELAGARASLTARSIDRLLKVARTIADLADKPEIDCESLDSAAAFRDLDPTQSGREGVLAEAS